MPQCSGSPRRVLLVALLLSACARTDTATLATPLIDTLPGGIVRVRNPGPTAWTDSSGWRLVEELTIAGTPDSSSELSNPWMIAVDSRGRLYVSDETIKLFDADGRFLRIVGRLGEGPGEYRAPMIGTAGDRLLVQDANLSRFSVFDSASHFLRSWHTIGYMMLAPSANRREEVAVWIRADRPDQGSQYARYAMDGTPRDTLELAPTGEPPMWHLRTGAGGWSYVIPFSPKRMSLLTPGGGVLVGTPAEYTLVLSRTGRDTALIFGRSWTPTPVSERRRTGEVARIAEFLTRNQQNFGGIDSAEIARQLRVEDMPATAPAYTDLATDTDGNIWVKLDPGDDTLHSRYDVFTAAGVYLGPVRAPAVFEGASRTIWSGDAVYSLQQTPEGLPVVKRYRIEKGR